MASKADYGFSTTFLKKHPSVARVVYRAVREEWDQTRFIAGLHQTKWWRQRSDSMRRWDALRTENPAEARRQTRIAQTTVRQTAKSMGVRLDAKQSKSLVNLLTVNGLTDLELRRALAMKFKLGPWNRVQTGQAAETINGLQKMAAEYGVHIGRPQLANRVRQIIAGTSNMEGFRDFLQRSAMRQYKSVAADIKAGHTVAEILDPYLQIAQQELGINPADVDITRPLWNAPLRGGGPGVDPQAAMTFDEWTERIRSNPSYGWDKTTGARKAAASFSGELLKQFGSL